MDELAAAAATLAMVVDSENPEVVVLETTAGMPSAVAMQLPLRRAQRCR